MIDLAAEIEVVAKGLNVLPAWASGAIGLDADTAEERGMAGESVILVRWETTPDDFHGMVQAAGILTAHGGLTSHARPWSPAGWARPASLASEALHVDVRAKTARLSGHELKEGDTITIDGGTGEVIVGSVPLVPPRINDDFSAILEWADGIRRLRVRTNADTPEDAAKAREFGAEGIGLLPDGAHVRRRRAAPPDAGDDPRRRRGGPALGASTACSRSSRATSKASSRRWRDCR